MPGRVRPAPVAGLALVALCATGCVGYGSGLESRWDASDQVWRAEASQVQVRSAQSRFFDTTDRIGMLRAIVATLQDLGFQIEVLDETLGIVSAKQYQDIETDAEDRDATYLLYDEESLVVFQNAYRTWGPFERRLDLIRLTVTVRRRNAEQLIVRASVQHYLRAIENPEPYQRFYAALQQSLFSQQVEASEDRGPSG